MTPRRAHQSGRDSTSKRSQIPQTRLRPQDSLIFNDDRRGWEQGTFIEQIRSYGEQRCRCGSAVLNVGSLQTSPSPDDPTSGYKFQ